MTSSSTTTTTTSAAVRSARPAPAGAAGVPGLVAAASGAFMAFLLVALGGLTAEEGTGVWWLLRLVAAVVAQAWGAVRLLRRRGWRLLALGSVLGILPLAVLVALWFEHHQTPS